MRKNLRPEDLGDFLDQPKCATLATHFNDGSILMSPVWYEWKNGGFTVAVVADDVKVRHVQRDAQVSISVAEDVAPYRGIEVRGTAKIDRNDALETMRRIAVRYLGPKQGEVYFAAVGQVDLALIRIEPAKLRVWDFVDETALTGEG